MKTKVINLFAGPGVGKSTLAADVYSALKKQGKSVELVREFVKDWAWQGKAPGIFDQLFILGNQSYAESMLYGKVEYIVTDSPLLLSPFYEKFNYKVDTTSKAVKNFIRLAEKNGVTYLNVWLARTVPYNPAGRFQTQKDIYKLDFNIAHVIPKKNLISVNPMNKNAVDRILKCL